MNDIALHVVLTTWFVVAESSGGADSLENFHVAEMTEEGGVIVVASHSANHSNLYISDVVSPYEVTGFLRAIR